MSILNNYLSKLEKLRKAQIAAVELEYEMRADLFHLTLDKVTSYKPKLRFNMETENGLSIRSAIVQVLRSETTPIKVKDIAAKVCVLLPDRSKKKVSSQVSVALSSYSEVLFHKVGRGMYILNPDVNSEVNSEVNPDVNSEVKI